MKTDLTSSSPPADGVVVGGGIVRVCAFFLAENTVVGKPLRDHRAEFALD